MNLLQHIVATLPLLFLAEICIGQTNVAINKNPQQWKTIVIPSFNSVTIPPAPAKETTKAELKEVLAVQSKLDSTTQKQIHYWNAGPPVYRWQKISEELFAPVPYWVRVGAYMNVAIYDATIAAWNIKYKYNRKRPYEESAAIKNLLESHTSPSYPCEYSVAAGAAATVLGYLYPAKKDSLLKVAREAGQSRIAAGVQYPSDVSAGFELGVKVGEQIIARAKQDGYENPLTIIPPKGKEFYTGRIFKKDVPNMKTWVLSSSSQFRSPPPPDLKQDMEEIKNNQPDTYSKYKSFRWEYSWPWGEIVEQKILEYNLSNNACETAFIYAVLSISDYDNQIAHWDSKYTHFRARPDQYDTTYVALFPTPPSPSYPAGHGTMAYTRATVLSYLFPYDRKLFFDMAAEANHSRFDAGVHYKTDNDAGETLGRQVGAVVVEWAKNIKK